MSDEAPADILDTLLEQAVEQFARATHFPIVFGGFQTGGVATVTALSGNRTSNLEGLRVARERGLGGKALAEARPRFTSDYASSAHITHDYDEPILSEGITSLVAVPIVVDGVVRAMLYGGERPDERSGTAQLRATGPVAQRFARDLSIHDSVRHHFERQQREHSPIPGTVLEVLRAQQAELRRLRHDHASDEALERIEELERALTRLVSPPDTADARPLLSPRELDVLAQLALGLSNAAIGASLGLTESTIKSYMKSIMSKLDAATRHEALTRARLHRLIV